jgi:hypothetical protein
MASSSVELELIAKGKNTSAAQKQRRAEQAGKEASCCRHQSQREHFPSPVRQRLRKDNFLFFKLLTLWQK